MRLSEFKPPFTAELASIKDSVGHVLINADAVKENYDLARDIAEALNQTKPQTCWLIETARQTWWDGRKVGEYASFTDKPGDALRFARFKDAERVRCWLLERQSGPDVLRSTEHIFCSPATDEGK